MPLLAKLEEGFVIANKGDRFEELSVKVEATNESRLGD